MKVCCCVFEIPERVYLASLEVEMSLKEHLQAYYQQKFPDESVRIVEVDTNEMLVRVEFDHVER
jgi:hypothetical protein